jgi:iron complex outermembrane receptor protein
LIAGSLCAATLFTSGTALAQEEGVLEQIVVTATFRETRVQDTPIAITAISGDTLEQRSQLRIPEIAAQAPNVTMTQAGAFGGNSLTAFIRGVGQVDYIPAVEPGVGIHVDEVYYASITGSVLDLLDLDRVEILRGPQGVLGGKNAVGGAIKLHSKKPSGDMDGFVEAGFGEYNAVRIRGASNFTLIEDRLWGRISGTSMTREGYVKNLDYGCTHPGSGFPDSKQTDNCVIGTEGGIDYVGARLALRAVPNDDLELNFSFNIVEEQSEPIPNVPVNFGPTAAPMLDFPTGGPSLIWDNALDGAGLHVPGLAKLV